MYVCMDVVIHYVETKRFMPPAVNQSKQADTTVGVTFRGLFFSRTALFICFSMENLRKISYLPTPPLGQDMTQGQFLSEV